MADEPEFSEAVQRALLPDSPPEIPDWSLATFYEPAGEDLLVGGDFYDWFRRPDGTFALMVGDVEGKGSLAAALGLSIRKGLKVLSFALATVEEAVDVLEVALEQELGTTLVSFCYLELSERPYVRILSVGHPAPWLVRDGVAREIDIPHNPLFGLRGAVSIPKRSASVEVEVRPGDLLLAYSDGLSEARLPDGRQFGEGPLQEFLEQIKPGMRPWELALALSERLQGLVGRLKDDLVFAVLARD